MSPKQKQRIYIALIGLSALSLAVALVLYALSQNINLFFTPTDIIEQTVDASSQFRLGGMVVKNSVQREKELKVK
ncbi:MAG: cytochrome c maturation protein CcmE, partial [Candidatus Berkiella sp.]